MHTWAMFYLGESDIRLSKKPNIDDVTRSGMYSPQNCRHL